MSVISSHVTYITIMHYNKAVVLNANLCSLVYVGYCNVYFGHCNTYLVSSTLWCTSDIATCV